MLIIDLAFEKIIVREKVLSNLRVVNPTACAIDCNILIFGGFNKRHQVNKELYVMTVQGLFFDFYVLNEIALVEISPLKSTVADFC